MRRLLLPCAMIFCGAAFGQKALTQYFPAGEANAGLLVQGYIRPMSEDIGTLASNGWYNTAATHKKFGFDISITMNSVFLSNSRKSFTEPALTNTSFLGTTPSNVDLIPSIYGKKGDVPNFANSLSAPQNPGVPFQGPEGIDPKNTYGVNAQVLPTIQAGFGLFAKTDIRARYTPQSSINGITTSSLGGAIMHDIKQHIPGLKQLPFSLSILVGYTQVNGKVDLSGTYGPSSGDGSAQEGKITSSATTAQALISKSLGFVTFYGGLGYNSTTTKFDVNGSYVVSEAVTQAGTVPLTDPFTLTNPYKYSFKTSGFRFTGGIRMKLGVFFLGGDYTLYNGQQLLTVGTGFTFH